MGSDKKYDLSFLNKISILDPYKSKYYSYGMSKLLKYNLTC